MLLHAEVPAECCDCTVWCRMRFHLVLMENGKEEWAAPKDAARKGKDRHPVKESGTDLNKTNGRGSERQHGTRQSAPQSPTLTPTLD